MLDPSTFLQGGVVAFAGLLKCRRGLSVGTFSYHDYKKLTDVATNLLIISDFVNRTITVLVTGQQYHRHFVQPDCGLGWVNVQ